MMWDIDQMKPLSATVVLSLFTPSFHHPMASSGTIRGHHQLPDDAVERRKLGVNKERTTVALKGFI